MFKKIAIPPSLLRSFIEQKKLPGTVSFLHFLRRKQYLQDFYSACKRGAYALPQRERPSEKILFHGSPKAQAALVPNASVGAGDRTERNALVYATDDPNYAIFLAVLHLKNGSAGVSAARKNSILTVDLDFVNGPSKLKNGYVHIVSGDLFKKTKNKEYKTDKPVPVLFSIRVTPQDLTVPICIQTSTQSISRGS